MIDIPFYANTPDNTHCFQAAFKMVLGHFLPDKEFTFTELEELSGKKPGLSTWAHHMLLSLNKMGFKTCTIEAFDAEAFIEHGEEYLIKEFGKEAASRQAANSDLPYEQTTYRKFLNTGNYQNRIPLFQDIRDTLDKNGLAVVNGINSRKLDGKVGFIGHAVVIIDIDDTHITLHDPGLPPRPQRLETLEVFDSAWASPNNSAKSLLTVFYEPMQ